MKATTRKDCKVEWVKSLSVKYNWLDENSLDQDEEDSIFDLGEDSLDEDEEDMLDIYFDRVAKEEIYHIGNKEVEAIKW